MEFHKRKHPRLKDYDYSQDGFYYVTIHIAEGGDSLSRVAEQTEKGNVDIELTAAGEIAKEQLLDIEKRYPYVKIDKYVIMPTHIHVIMEFRSEAAEASPRPTLPDVICAYKSLTTRACNKRFQTPGKKLFQDSFYDSVLRNEKDYLIRWNYIDENPLKWYFSPEDI